MKKFIYFVGAATLISVFSCAGLKVERGVQDNIFYSSFNPKIFAIALSNLQCY